MSRTTQSWTLKQTFEHEGTELHWRAGGYAHAKQFKRLKKVLRRERTILGIVMREIRRMLVVRLEPGEQDTEAPNVGSWRRSYR